MVAKSVEASNRSHADATMVRNRCIYGARAKSKSSDAYNDATGTVRNKRDRWKPRLGAVQEDE